MAQAERTHHPDFRPMGLADLDAVMALERAAYPYPWTEGIFKDCLRTGYDCWVMEQDGQILGYAILSAAAGEAHLLNLCVAPACQGQGLGRWLLEKTLQLARWHQVDTVFLEVRVSNEAARALYEQAGFNEIGLRPGYYPAGEGREDAIVMARPMRFPAA